ncbi:MAG: DUF1109 domain-containing protein [Proteobacteria bacterium]|nr:DUF1109 domain-containing protein [Pseudomonadota bacterium]MYJ96835.1 DUF1109 domain-containing protein [Pseudomonadota bacterium]
MKCLYFLTPALKSAHTISDDLHAVGVDDWYIHVISKDEAGLKKHRIHSSNYIETMDIVRSGLTGAFAGFAVGMLGAVVLASLQPFGPNVPVVAYAGVVVLATFFGAWEGGLVGVSTENKKLKPFHDDIEAGKYLFLIYARKGMGEVIKAMMSEKHPESEHVATDRHFVNPFGDLRRKDHSAHPTSG